MAARREIASRLFHPSLMASMGAIQAGYEKPHVLVVDDEVDTADSSAMILAHYGYRADVAYHSEMALKIAGVRPPQAVLIDIAMPTCDGYFLARELRRLPGMQDALLICVSGYGTLEDRQKSREAGCQFHFIKPVDWQALLKTLEPLKLALSNV